MTLPTEDANELRVLLMTPTAKDAAMAATVLEPVGIAAMACPDLRSVVRELEHGSGAVLLAEEALDDMVASGLASVLKNQPAWSDLPILVLARQGADSNTIATAMDAIANVTVLERPMRVASLVSAVRSALRARRRQYELRDHLDRLRLADQRKTEFLATLAHELRNPMAPLSMTLEVLKRVAPTPQAAQRHYELMGRQVDHMVRLVDDLMEVSRITRGKIELQLEPLQLNRVIQDAIEQSRPLLDADKHQFEVQLDKAPMVIRGDRVRLAQIFVNLLNNAAKYTPAGGRIGIVAKREGNKAVVVVCDNGAGIAADMLPDIFEMFVQVSGTARVAQGGLGIGLTLVRSLVELHGGNVEARSGGLGQGTEFIVTLPIARQAQEAIDAPGPHYSRSQFAGNILIVDDNRDAADSLAELLNLSGAHAVVAYNGPDALKLAATSKPALAILDIGMPGMDGCELAERLLADPAHQGLRLAAITGWGQENDRLRVAAAGFSHHLLKPVDMGALHAMLAEVSTHTH